VTIRIDGARLLADLRQLATFGKAGTGVDRTAFSPPDRDARDWLVGRLQAAGLTARIDRIGNVYGQFPAVRRAIVIGSHTDTVPKGGWLDGALGVIYGLEIARTLAAAGAPKLGVDVASFQDEEGTFLPFLGSRAFCGDLSDADIAAARSKDGRALADVLAAANYAGAAARYDPARHAAYLEAHIEQGPRLEAEHRRLGIVTGIVGIRRFRLIARGQADHAGTTPMAMRKDAGAALVQLAARIGREFPKLGAKETVWNIGSISLRPGAANVVPSEGEMVLEFRDIDAAVLDRLEMEVGRWVAELARSGSVAVDMQPIARVAPTAMASELADVLAEVARSRGQTPLAMPSGAGHDATVIGRVAPAAMLFIPSIGGRSHDIVENTSDEDIVLGCEVLAEAVVRLGETLG
jgi:beta-ureidopropionase / N-carbamoyl-L-amino-acid hydrolase